MPSSAFSEVSLYEDMLRLHEKMLAAARALAWDQVIALEARSAKMVAALQANPSPSLAPEAKALVAQILALREKVQEEIAAWRQDVAPLIRDLAGHETEA